MAEPLPRNVIVVSAVSFFQDCASELVYPVLPLFLTGTLGAPVAVVGVIEGVAEATAAASKIVAGRMADRRRRRPLIGAGYALSSLGKLLVAVATVWPVVLVARFVDRLGKGVRTTPRDALIVAETPAAMRGRAFGFHRAADTAGAVVGPLLGLGLYELLDHRLRPLFAVAFIPAVVSVALVGLVREHTPVPVPLAETQPMHDPATLPPAYWRVVAFLAVFGVANFPDALLLLRAKQLGLGFAGVIGAYVLYNASYALLSQPAGTISDRVPRRWVFGTGLLVFAVTYAGLGIVTTSAWVWVLLPSYGAYTALTDGVGKAWVADLVPGSMTGTGLGVYQGISGAAMLVAGIWAGFAWHHTGRIPLVISGVTVAVLAAVLLVLGSRLEASPRSPDAATAQNW